MAGYLASKGSFDFTPGQKLPAKRSIGLPLSGRPAFVSGCASISILPNREQSRRSQRDGYGHTRRSNGWHQPANQPHAERPTDAQ